MRVSKDAPFSVLPHLANLLSRYRDVFAFTMEDMQLPTLLPPHKIKLKPGTQPVQVKRYRRPPLQDEPIARLARE